MSFKALLKTKEGNLVYLALRIFVGFAFMTHGYGKAFAGLKGFSSYVSELGIYFPQILGPIAAWSEFFGGALLIVGLFTRISSFFLACTMAVAVFVAHAGQPFDSKELSLVYLICCLLFLMKGAGKYSLDNII
ncbi:DoxX family protein [bacterium]